MTGAIRPYDTVKRVLDVVTSGVGLVVLSPVVAIVAVSVALKLGRPIVFAQSRPGKDGRVFRLYKFRTMKNVDSSKGLVTDAERMTPFGAALRSTSLDELPTLLNVIKGDMSLVGPRPLLVQYLERYSAQQARRHEVRPGITGLAQVRGRNSIGWDEKLALDVQYVDHRSLAVDLKIVWATVRAVVKREGISADGHVTMSEFTGSGEER
jgi:lipopolysaccharide/colanic/teichoic acid biosynthesis glycosyltransferase